MNLSVTIVALLATLSCAFAGEVDERVAALKIDSGWSEIDLTAVAKKENWSVRIFRHSERNELLTVACNSMLGDRSIDDVWEFAPSGYPYWFPQSQKYTINPIKAEWVNPKKFGERNRLAYTVVNEHESEKLEDIRMANGFRAIIDGRMYYVQHTASHPIPDWLARDWLERLTTIKLTAK